MQPIVKEKKIITKCDIGNENLLSFSSTILFMVTDNAISYNNHNDNHASQGSSQPWLSSLPWNHMNLTHNWIISW